MVESGIERLARLEREERKREISALADQAIPERVLFRKRRIGALYQYANLRGRSIQADGSLCACALCSAPEWRTGKFKRHERHCSCRGCIALSALFREK
jgi:hypothetical protein